MRVARRAESQLVKRRGMGIGPFRSRAPRTRSARVSTIGRIRRGITTTTCNLAPPSPSAFEDPEHQLQLRAKLLDRFRRERAARFRFELSRAAVLLDLLPRSLDCVFLGIKEVLYQHDELDFASLIHTVAGAVFRRIQEPELALPVPEHMRLEIGELAHFADGKELLDRLRPPSRSR